MRVAIIDLGTNTFNLLITECKDKQHFQHIFHDKYPVNLGENGINNNIITKEASKRALNAIRAYTGTIKQFKADKIYAFATSAIRGSSNGHELVNMLNKKFNLDIRVISGDKEAELIYMGVKQAVPLDEEIVLILDIGGGSNEFILANQHQIFWKCSYNLGVTRIIERFSPSSPIQSGEVEKIEAYFSNELNSLFCILNVYSPMTLIGSSGSFNNFAAMIAHKHVSKLNQTFHNIPLNEFYLLHKTLLISTSDERKKIKGLELIRVETIVAASIFVNFILKKHPFSKLMQSAYALKEGAISEIMNNLSN